MFTVALSEIPEMVHTGVSTQLELVVPAV